MEPLKPKQSLKIVAWFYNNSWLKYCLQRFLQNFIEKKYPTGNCYKLFDRVGYVRKLGVDWEVSDKKTKANQIV